MSVKDQTRTKSAYSFQWNRFRIIRPDEDRVTFRNRTGLGDLELQDKVVLDAGCGMGRYLRITAESPASLIVGLDLSLAVVAARELTSTLARVTVVRGDLLKLPLADGSFDHIYSLGVLDHTPDPRAAFLGLARLLKPGGRIAIWVYPRERAAIESIMNAQRAISTRLPVDLLRFLSRLSSPVGAIKRKLMSSRWRPVERLGVASIWQRSVFPCTRTTRFASATLSTGTPPSTFHATTSKTLKLGSSRPVWLTSST